jgi:hypothetical protein
MLRGRVGRAAGALALIGVVTVGGGADPATGATSGADGTCGSWAVVASPDVGANGSSFTGVSASSETDVWAVGNYFTGGIVYKTLIEHWDGGVWTVEPSRNIGTRTNSLNGVASLSATDAWAVGFYDDGTTFRTLAEHWNGTKWSVVPTPNDGAGENALQAVVAIAPNDVWAVGYRQATTSGSPRLTLAEHWNGTAWSVVPTPNVGTDENFLWSVTGLATDDLWAVGSWSTPWFQTLAMHWDGDHWSVVSTPNQGDGNNVLYAALEVGPSQTLAVGNWLDASNTPTLAERWDGSMWKIARSQSPGDAFNFLTGLAAHDRRDAWSVGWRQDPFASARTLTEHYDGRRWTVAQSPNVGMGTNMLAAVANVPGTAIYWAVGHSESGGVDHTLTEQRC